MESSQQNGPKTLRRNQKYVCANVQECLDVMQGGTDMVKVRHSKMRHEYKRTYFLDPEGQRIRWEPSSKSADKSRIPIRSITEVREGHQSDVFRQFHGCYHPDQCFSVVHGSNQEQLDLVAPTELKAMQWIIGLRNVVKNAAKSSSMEVMQFARDQWLKETYEAADKNGDGSLNLEEVIGLVKKLNMGLSMKQAKRLFIESDTNCFGEGANSLDLAEFRDFYKAVSTRDEIYYLMMKYSSSGEEHLNEKDLLSFLQTDQKQTGASLADCRIIINKYEPTAIGKTELWLGVDGFTQLLLGPEGQMFNPEHAVVHQDMTHPLSQYFINSSHNTYLTGDQLASKSSVDMYIKVLKMGCKCIELDCWDGPEGEPLIYHGYTLTSKVKFWDVIQAIKQFAFAVSPYPVILSIENHCSVAQQETMAQQMKQVFKDSLLKEKADPDQKCLPSPESLKGKILIKNKKLDNEEVIDGWVSDEDEGEDARSVSPKMEDPKEANGGTSNGTQPEKVFSRRKMAHRSLTLPDMSPTEEMRELSEGKRPGQLRSKSVSAGEDDELDIIDSASQKKRRLHRDLSKLVIYTQSSRFRGFRKSQTLGKYYELCSFSESRALRCVTAQRAGRFVLHNMRQLSRIYPAGYRVNSSNYSPVDVWNCGSQLVALNFQKNDKGLQINQARFKVNGNCGFVLKPTVLREESHHFNPHTVNPVSTVSPVEFTIKIISGQQLPKPNGVEKGEIIDPYVKVEILGIPADCAEERTKYIDDNGFNPIWNETFIFHILMPELALVRFVVMDKDVISDDYIGQATFPLTSLMQGYRHVSLEGEGTELATVFVHVNIKDSVHVKPKRRSRLFATLLRSRKKRRTPKQPDDGIVMISHRRIGTVYDSSQRPVSPHNVLSSGSEVEQSSRELSPGDISVDLQQKDENDEAFT